MTILIYQITIITTICIARALTKKAVTPVCLVWTVITLFSVHYSPLIILQLITIWTCNFLLTKVGSPSTAPKSNVNSQQEASEVSAQIKLSSAPQSIIKDMSHYFSVSSEVQKVTAALKNSIEIERRVIEQAMSFAEAELKTSKFFEAKGPSAEKHFKDAYLKYTQILRKPEQEAPTAALEDLVPPDFENIALHPNPEIAETIEREVSALRNERDAFIKMVAGRLKSNAKLAEIFKNTIEKRRGGAIWTESFKLSLLVVPNFADILRESRSTSARPEPSREQIELIEELIMERKEFTRLRMKRAAIEERSKELQIPWLIHFTHVENLPSIIAHGLQSISALNAQGLRYRANDDLRLDGHLQGSSLSIAHPNDKLFANCRWKNPRQDWAVLILDRSILWTKNVAFCQYNAADHRIFRQSKTDLMSRSAFDAMFSESDDLPVRESDQLKPFDPTDVQAEILAFETLPPELITGVSFNNPLALEIYKGLLGDRRVSLSNDGKGFFGARSYARKSSWVHG